MSPTTTILVPYLAVIFFFIWVAKVNPLQTDVKVYLSVFEELALKNTVLQLIKWLLEYDDITLM